LDAQYFGVAQRRRRVFVVASARDDFDPAAVLLEWEGLRRDSAPSREAGKVAPTIPSRSTAGGGLGTDFDCDGGVIQQPIAQCLTTGTGQRYDPETETLLPCVFPTLEANDGKKWGSNQWVNQGKAIVQPITYSTPSIGTIVEDSVASCITKNSGAGGETQNPAFVIQPVTHSLRGEGFDASEDGTGRGTPLVPVAFHPTQDPISSTDGTTHAMGTGSAGGCATVAVALVGGVDYENNGHTSEEPTGPLLKGSPTGGGRPLPAIALTSMQVRRLTPVECERLQGFPDGYTAIPWRGKPVDNCPDGPRYKALGNSWAVPVVRWIGSRIQDCLSIKI
jgi:DNA (cytosine-5)-methyltransferase 1